MLKNYKFDLSLFFHCKNNDKKTASSIEMLNITQ